MTKTPRSTVLIVDDETEICDLVSYNLAREGYRVLQERDGEAGLDRVFKSAPDLLILDLLLPKMSGLEVLGAIRNEPRTRALPVLVLTARSTEMDKLVGFERGADDYLTKPFYPQELEARLRVGKRILELEDRLVAASKVLQFEATHDALTELWNRAAILDALHRELSRARREGGSVGILLADLDHFKSINDTRGHLAGDAVLREVARRLTGAVRDYDAAGRYGGEEFLVVLPGCNATTTRDRAEQLRLVVGSHPVVCAEGEISVTLSVGALSSGEWGRTDLDALLRAADAALYRAKHGGRNRVEMAEPGAVPGVVSARSEDGVTLQAAER